MEIIADYGFIESGLIESCPTGCDDYDEICRCDCDFDDIPENGPCPYNDVDDPCWCENGTSDEN